MQSLEANLIDRYPEIEMDRHIGPIINLRTSLNASKVALEHSAPCVPKGFSRHRSGYLAMALIIGTIGAKCGKLRESSILMHESGGEEKGSGPDERPTTYTLEDDFVPSNQNSPEINFLQLILLVSARDSVRISSPHPG